MPPSGYGITKKRRYRAAQGSDGAEFRLVEEIDVTVASTIDNTADVDLGSVLETDPAWLPAPAELRGIAAMANGMLGGIVDNQWIPTPINRPHAWLADAAQATDYPIVAWTPLDIDEVMATQTSVYVVTGSDPYGMSMSKPEPGGCVSERSMAAIAGVGAIFAGVDALIAASRSRIGPISGDIIGIDAYHAMDPSSIFGIAHNGRYFGFWDNGTATGGFIFDPVPGRDGWIPLDFHATAGFSDPQSGNLYLVVDGELVIWDAGATKRPYLYRSPLYILPQPTSLAYGQIHVQRGGTETLTFRLMVDDADGNITTWEREVTSSSEFLLPALVAESTVQWELEGTRTVKRWPVLAEDIGELEV